MKAKGSTLLLLKQTSLDIDIINLITLLLYQLDTSPKLCRYCRRIPYKVYFVNDICFCNKRCCEKYQEY